VYRNVDRGDEGGGIVLKQVEGKGRKEWVKKGGGYITLFPSTTKQEKK
jgi:hypothetical protein